MGEDIARQVHSFHHISDEEGTRHVDNEVLLLLQEELERKGSMSGKVWLANF